MHTRTNGISLSHRHRRRTKTREREREKKNVLCALFYQRTPVEEREKISGRYTLLYIYILFVVVGTAAALIGSSI